MSTVQATFAATLVDEWVRAGVTDAVVAPGSRSAPLALALATHPGVRVEVLLDERSAGFFALGRGLATGRPAVVVTTSGTAAVELHPAVVEAAHARVPLLAVTADRPPELHGVGAPQTIDQAGLFGAAPVWSADPGVARAATAYTWRSLGARAAAEALAGPVHLNLPFVEPLVGEAGPLPAARSGGRPWHEVRAAAPQREFDLRGHRRGVVVAGRGARGVEAFAAAGWPVLADPLSGWRVPATTTVAAFDALLRHRRFAAGREPDVIVRLGAPPASKALAAWLATQTCEQLAVGGWLDPDRTATTVVAGRACFRLELPDPHWTTGWAKAEAAAQDAIDEVLADHTEPTEPDVARQVAACLPSGSKLFVSSSMPVRDVEWFARPRTGLRVLANRGASGIDGVTSTALGAGATAALVGDLAYLHDLGGLLAAARRDADCALVVVDNDGGGIFSFLPQAAALATERFEWLFGTPHGLDLGAITRACGLPVDEPSAAVDVGPAVVAAVAAGGVRVVLVRTERATNVAVHAELQAAVAAALDAG